MKLSSSAFKQRQKIPAKYTCDGEGKLSPPLLIEDVPEAAESLVLIADDPDVPKQLRPDGNFTHWVSFNISPTTTDVPEGGPLGTLGVNTRGELGYIGPCPPPQYEPKEHRYIFKLYALDTELDLKEGASKEEVESAMKDHVIVETELIGIYSRMQ